MPDYEITSPDGRKFRVTAPDGASQDDVLAYAKANMGAASTAPQPEKQKPNLRTQIMDAGLPMLGGSYAADLAMGGRQALDALAQMAARGTGLGVKQTEAANKAALDDYQQNYAPDSRIGADFVRGVGQALVTALITPAIKAGGIIKSAAQGTGVGAATGALTPVYDATSDADFWAKKQDQAQIGAATGGITAAGGGALGRVLAPKVNPQAQQLLDAGVTPTPGQIFGGAVKTTEEKARSIPFIGDAITSGQRRGIEEYNRAIYRKALEPIGKGDMAKSLPVGNDGIRAVGDALSQAYESALARSVPSPFDMGAQSALMKIEGMVPKSKRGDFADIIEQTVRGRLTPANTLTPTAAKEADSALGQLASGYRGSSTFEERQLGQALEQAQREVRKLITRYNKVTGFELRKIDQGWSNLVQLENAGAMQGAKDGIFTPAQFMNAVKKSDKTVRDRAFARGEARNQDIAQAADAVLSQKYPDSGTAGRVALGAVGAGGAAMMNPLIPLAGALGALAYTPVGQRAVAAAMTRRLPWMKEAGGLSQQLAPYLAAPATAGLLSF